MKPHGIQKITALLIICLFIIPSPGFAQQLNLLQKIMYKEVGVLDPNGTETLTLVNRFTDTAEYIYGANKWIPAPRHIRYCYKNQADIKARFKKSERYTPR